MIKWMKKHKQALLYVLGLLIAAVSFLPYFILKENIWVPFHDQLDGEVPNYIYQAKYIFKGDIIPEVMNGIPKTGMIPPAPMGVLFFMVLSPFRAYVSLQIVVTVVSYTGMFLLVSKATDDCRVGFLCGCLFAYLPFMPVYGLSIAGLPVLWYAFWMLYEKKKIAMSYILIVLYAGFSSFILVGFAVCVTLFIALICLALKRGIKEKSHMIWGFSLLCITYVIFNFSLFTEIMPWTNVTEEVSHRTEFVISPLSDYLGQFRTVFLGESIYTPAYAGWICGITLAVLILCLVFKKKEMIRIPLALMSAAAVIAGLSLLWDSSLCINTLRQSGPLKYFQVNRISWLIPPVWYILLGFDFKIILQLTSSCGSNVMKKFIGMVGYAAVFAVCLIMTAVIYNQSFFYHQLRQVIFPDTYKIMTWNQYYACDVFEQINETIGRDKSEYRVVSLGMSPAAALYNGFYCLDGYSNNYPLSYKHEFRKVMEKELAKSEAMRIYFDDWGNRCYLMSSESGGSPMISKYAATAYQDLEIDTVKLADMGCEYLFSAMEITGADGLGLSPEGVFETPSGYYKVYVYSLK